ncbi:MAG: HDOD domain-containing protein [Mariprofundaceae bacterium]
MSQTLVETIRNRIVSGDAKLPLLPKAVLDVRDIVKDESKGAKDISKALSHDPTFSTTVVRMANSARFNTSGKEVLSLPVAIQRLGGRRTLQLLIAASSKMHMQVKNPSLQGILDKVTHHSLMVATAAQHLAQLIRSADPDEAFLAGLLHNIGVSAIVCSVPDALETCDAKARMQAISLLRREIGGRILTQWGMPDIFSSIAVHHGIESDDRPREKLIDYVDAADFLIQQRGHPSMFDPISETLDIENYPAIKRLNATETHLAAVEVELDDNIKELTGAMG